MQKRDLVLWIILAFVTCGIGPIIWMIFIADDVKKIAQDQQSPSGGVVVLLTIVTCGIYGIYWAYTASQKLAKVDPTKQDNSILNLVLYLVCMPAALAMMQNQINHMIDAHHAAQQQ